jgi:hypothetical protein
MTAPVLKIMDTPSMNNMKHNSGCTATITTVQMIAPVLKIMDTPSMNNIKHNSGRTASK